MKKIYTVPVSTVLSIELKENIANSSNDVASSDGEWFFTEIDPPCYDYVRGEYLHNTYNAGAVPDAVQITIDLSKVFFRQYGTDEAAYDDAFLQATLKCG